MAASTPPGRVQARWLAIMALIAGLCVGGMQFIGHHLGGFVKRTRQQHSLRVMTWNIGKLYLSWESRAADRDLEHVAAVIHKLDPQVVALQELRDNDQIKRLAALMGPDWRGRAPQDRYDRRAGLLTRLPVQFFPLATSSGRVAQGAEITWRDGRKLTMVSTHLDAFDAARRRQQAEELLAGLDRRGVEDLFLVGDFNFDPAVTAQGSADQQLYSYLTGRLVDAAKYAGLTTIFSRRLDYIFFHSKRVHSVTSRIARKHRINMMDHDPVVAEFSF